MVVFLLGTVVLLSLRHWQVHVWTQTLVCGQFKATGKHESCHRCLYPSGEWVSMWGFCDSSIPWCRFHWATGGTWEAVGLLKGPNYSKSALCDQEPTFYAHFQLIWKIRDNHTWYLIYPHMFFFFSSVVTNRVVFIHGARLTHPQSFRRGTLVVLPSINYHYPYLTPNVSGAALVEIAKALCRPLLDTTGQYL